MDKRYRMEPRHLIALCTVAFAGAAGGAGLAGAVTPLSSGTDAKLPAAWQLVALPKIPRHTRYELVTVDGRRVVRADADGSYTNVVHPLNGDTSGTPILRWSWRVDRFPAGSDPTTKAGDDFAAKVCVLLDLPLDRLSFGDRLKVELGRRLFDPDLPAATLCYVWDRTTKSDAWFPNIYTDRVRMLPVRSAARGEQERWFDEKRDLRADFAKAFPDEARGGLPRIAAVAFASDADNTGSSAVAWFGDISLTDR